MTYTAAAKTTDLTEGGMIAATVNGHKLLLAQVGGQVYAMAAKCPHMGADLCKGKLEGATVVCPMHGAAFNVTNGAATGPAKILFFKKGTRDAVVYPVRVEDGQVLVKL